MQKIPSNICSFLTNPVTYIVKCVSITLLNEEYSLKKKKKKKEMWLLCDWNDIEIKAVFSLLYVQSLCLVQFRSNYNDI